MTRRWDGAAGLPPSRNGQPIGAPLTVTDRRLDGAGRVLVLDFAVTVADGDDLLELTAKSGDVMDLGLVPFRVAR